MEAILGPQIIKSYKRLSYKPWYALAEFIDNSTQAYFNNKQKLDVLLDKEGKQLTVTIDYRDDALTITDNSSGMNLDELEYSMSIGKPPEDSSGRSKYGLGMKTAACWFGNEWSVTTKKFDDNKEYKIIFNVNRIADGNLDLGFTEKDVNNDKHYTVIKITDLNNKIKGRTKSKVWDFLKSMYRKDFKKHNLNLLWTDARLTKILEWDYDEQIGSRIMRNIEGNEYKRNCSFNIRGKNVKGWICILSKGSRKDAGISIIQNDRIIKGWPDAWRPSLLFGEARNDMVNQRIVGELYFEDFDVTHTKDNIIFEDNDEQELESLLFDTYADYLKIANQPLKSADDIPLYESIIKFTEAIEDTVNNIDDINYFVFFEEIETLNDIRFNNSNVIETVKDEQEPSKIIEIGDNLKVKIYIERNLSINDPYVLHQPDIDNKSVIIIINVNHPYWSVVCSNKSTYEFMMQCTYDGIAEWKAAFKERLEYDTIKDIKDNLLRLKYKNE